MNIVLNFGILDPGLNYAERDYSLPAEPQLGP